MIESIVFDLSEVLIPGLIGVEEKLERHTGVPRNLLAKAMGSYPYYEVENHLDRLLKGSLSYQDYRSEVFLNAELSGHFITLFDEECISMFKSAYPYTEQLLNQVAIHCDLYLLSDHCEEWVPQIMKQHSFFSKFKGCVWSYEVGATKKSIKPFESIIKRYQLSPSSCLFIDDNATNINIASGLGFNTVHFKGEKSIKQIYSAIENG